MRRTGRRHPSAASLVSTNAPDVPALPPEAADDGAGIGPRLRRNLMVRNLIANATSLAVVVPLVAVVLVAGLWAVLGEWAPLGDFAAIQLRVLDVGGSDTPLIGMPTTLAEATGEPAHHLGAAQFWLLAPPLWVASTLTNSSGSLVLAATTLSVTAIVAGVWTLARLGLDRVAAVSAALFAAAAVVLAGPTKTSSPWNPDFAFVMTAVAMTVTAVALGRRVTLGVALVVVLTASAAAQAHMSYLGPALVLLVALAVALVRDVPAGDRRRVALVIGIVSTVVWSGPLLDVVVNGGGNVWALASADASGGVRWLAALDRFANSVTPWEFGLRRPTDGVNYGRSASWLTRLFALGTVAVVVAIAARTRVGGVRRHAVLAVAIVLVTVAAAAIAPANLATAFGSHVQRAWILPVLLVWSVPLVVVLRRLRSRAVVIDRRWAVVFALPTIVMGWSLVTDADRDVVVRPDCSGAVTALASAAVDSFGGSIDVYDSRRVGMDTFGFGSQVSSGVYAEIERRAGGAAVVGRFDPGMIGAHRLAATAPVDTSADRTVVVTETSDPVDVDHVLIATVTGPSDCAGSGGSATLSLWRSLPGVDRPGVDRPGVDPVPADPGQSP